MTTAHESMDLHDTDAKLSRQQRGQLSALLDGELAPDQARFLLRRLGHDADLAACWQRWQLAGDVLRGRPVAALAGGADGFAQAVARDVAASGVRPAPGFARRWRHGIGLAAAASVAALAMFVAPPLSLDGDMPAPPLASSPAGETAVERAVVQPPAGPEREVSVPQFAAATPAEPAAQAPGRIAAAPRSPPPPAESVPPSAPALARDPPPAVLVAAPDGQPFATPAGPQARPWPRAGLGGDGPLTVGFSEAPGAPSFYPFEPQLPAGEGDSERTP